MSNPCTKHPDGPQHDCSYVEARNALIPKAEARALDRRIVEGGPDITGQRYSRMFHEAMTELAVEEGLVRGTVTKAMAARAPRAAA